MFAGGGLLYRVYLSEKATKLKLGKERLEPFPVRLRPGEVSKVDLQRDIAPQRGQGSGKPRQLGMRADFLAELAGDGWRMAQQIIQVMPLVDELNGGLLPYARDAGDVIGRVAHQPLDLHHATGLDAKLGLDLLDADAFVLHGIEQRHPLRNELHQIFIAGDNDHFSSLLLPARC